MTLRYLRCVTEKGLLYMFKQRRVHTKNADSVKAPLVATRGAHQHRRQVSRAQRVRQSALQPSRCGGRGEREGKGEGSITTLNNHVLKYYTSIYDYTSMYYDKTIG